MRGDAHRLVRLCSRRLYAGFPSPWRGDGYAVAEQTIITDGRNFVIEGRLRSRRIPQPGRLASDLFTGLPARFSRDCPSHGRHRCMRHVVSRQRDVGVEVRWHRPAGRSSGVAGSTVTGVQVVRLFSLLSLVWDAVYARFAEWEVNRLAATAEELTGLPLPRMLTELASSAEGLTEAEARRRLQRYGPNEIVERHRNSILVFLGYFWAPIPWMIEAALSLVARHWADVGIIAALLAMNGLVAFIEEHQVAGGRINSRRSSDV